MEKILGGLVLVNGTDIWSTYGVFLVEDKRGGMDNLTAILTPSKTKTDTAVNIREEDGEKYSSVLTPRNEACPGHINVIQTLFKRRLNKIQTC